MKKHTHEVERIARAERMLSEHASTLFLELVRKVGAACDITIHEMHITVRSESDRTPEPKAHFVITGARMRPEAERERGSGDRSAYAAAFLSSARQSPQQ